MPAARHLSFVGAMLLACASSIHAQRGAGRDPSTGSWVDLGLSAGAYGSLGAAIAFTRVTERGFWRGRVHAQGNEGWTVEPSKTVRTLGELGIERGRAIGPCGSNWCGIAGGIAYVETSRRSGGDEETREKTIGATGEVFLVSSRAPHLTAGLFANLNPVAPYGGFMLSVALGRVPVTR